MEQEKDPETGNFYPTRQAIIDQEMDQWQNSSLAGYKFASSRVCENLELPLTSFIFAYTEFDEDSRIIVFANVEKEKQKLIGILTEMLEQLK